MRAGHGSGSRAALACVLALLAGGLVPGAAGAAAPRTVAEFGSGPGKVSFPVGVAVDRASGDLYVADRNNFRIDKFDVEGEFLVAWGWGVADGKSLELQACGPAAEPPSRRCFEAAEVEGSHGAHNEDGPGAVKPVSVAVDPSGHDVYVADATLRRVTKFTPSGEFLFMVGKEVDKTTGADICRKEDIPPEGTDECGKGGAGPGPGEFTHPASLVIDGSGRVWVGDTERISSFDSDGSPGPEVELPEAGETPSLAIGSGGDFYVAREETGERQEVSFEGFADGDTFTIGNLPAACESSTTDAIEYGGGGITRNQRMQGALVKACGAGSFIVTAAGSPTASKVTFAGALAGVDDPLVSCAPVSGAGSCPVTPISDGVPGKVERLEAGTGAPIGALDEGGFPRAIAIDGEDHLYVGDAKPPYRLIEYDSEGNKVGQFGAGQVLGEPAGNALALDEGSEEPGEERPATLYAASSDTSTQSAVQAFELPAEGPLPGNQRAEGLLPTEATLRATLNPEGNATAYRFQYGTSEAYGSETPTPPRTLGEEGSPDEGFEDRPVSATLKGLVPDTTYHFRLCANSSAGENCGPDTTFRTRTAVGIEAQWVSSLSAHEATLDATLDPLGAGNAVWWVEYDTSPYGESEAAHGVRTPEAPLPPSSGALHRAAPLAGLAADATYHYRFVARGEQDNHPYTVHGPDQTFTTQPAALGLSLPDNRAWEMVSPPEKHGARLRFPSEGQVQAAANGETLAYLSRGSVEADPEGSRSPEDTSVLGRRTGAGKWASQDITPPNASVVRAATNLGLEYKLFSPNLVEALLEPRSGTPLALSASERTPYLRQNSEPPAYTPLVSGCPPEGQACPAAVAAQADVPSGTEFGGDPVNAVGAVRVAGSSADLAHVVLKSSVSLTCYETPETGRWNDSACSDENTEHQGGWESAPTGTLYEWTAAGLEPASVKPGKEVAVVSAELGSDAASVRGAISEDGTRVFFTASDALYVRDTALGQTVRLDAEQPGAFGTGEAEPVFQGASEAGTVAFFTDTQNLTEDANESGADLYRCGLVIEEGELKCDLTDLTAQTYNPADRFESAEVQGLLSGMSEDATRLYFVGRGVLEATANPRGESAVPGQPNLYLWRQGSGTRFIATLAGEDRHDWGVLKPGDTPLARQLSSSASPSGRYLAFTSEASLTGYDNRDAASGEADQEVFLYASDEDRLICASCDPSGARPRGRRGFESSGSGGLPPAYDPQELWADIPGRPLAAVLPDATRIAKASPPRPSLYRPRAIHDNGRLFFNAADSLVGADSNGNWDVYQYEPTGTGDCAPSSGAAATARSGDGCVSLISSGTAEGESAFVDASVGGNDVFFWTNAQLSVNDVDHVTDVYDARVDGVAATLDPVAECQGEACQPPATPPEAQTPGSATFRGPANPRGGASRCTGAARGAKRLTRRARKLRRAARQMSRKGNPRTARRTARRSRRLAHRAKAQSKRAKRCRARANRRSRR